MLRPIAPRPLKPSPRSYSEGQHPALPVVQKRAGLNCSVNVRSVEADAGTSVPQRMTALRPLYPMKRHRREGRLPAKSATNSRQLAMRFSKLSGHERLSYVALRAHCISELSFFDLQRFSDVGKSCSPLRKATTATEPLVGFFVELGICGSQLTATTENSRGNRYAACCPPQKAENSDSKFSKMEVRGGPPAPSRRIEYS